MKKLKDFKSISALLNNEKAVKIIVVAGFGIILLILISEIFNFGGNGTAVNAAIDPVTYAEQLEGRLVEILSQIQGVGRVKVMITLESLEESVPKVRGVAVVCEGGADVFVKQKVIETVSRVLGISTARVSVTY